MRYRACCFNKRRDLILNTPFGNIEWGDASKGLCAGMVYAVRDYVEAGQLIPPGDVPPDSGPLFDFIVRRLFEGFDLPGGVTKYLELMHPGLSDHETGFSRIHLALHGRSWRMVAPEWPLIRADLDTGHACPLGLVCIKSADLGKLGQTLNTPRQSAIRASRFTASSAPNTTLPRHPATRALPRSRSR